VLSPGARRAFSLVYSGSICVVVVIVVVVIVVVAVVVVVIDFVMMKDRENCRIQLIVVAIFYKLKPN